MSKTMTPDDIQELFDKVEKLKASKTKAETMIEHNLKLLKDNYEVDSLEKAKDLFHELCKELKKNNDRSEELQKKIEEAVDWDEIE